MDLIYEVNDMKENRNITDSEIEISLEADTISMKSVLTTSNPIRYDSEMNKLLGFTSKTYPEGTHRLEKAIMISSVDKVHLRCDCVDGSIVKGVRAQILYSFNLSTPPGQKTIKKSHNFYTKR